MPDDCLKIASLLIDAQLALGAGAVFQNGMDVFDRTAAAEIVHNIIDKIKKLESEVPHGNFSLFAEVDELALELLDFVDDVVDDLGSRSAVEYVHTILKDGTSAERQLRVYQQTGDLKAVVRHLVAETRGVSESRASSAHAIN